MSNEIALTHDAALEMEAQIIAVVAQTEVNFLRIGQLLSQFKRGKGYIAKGYKNFQEWANSPDLHGMEYRTAQNLVRIVEEAIPLLETRGLLEYLPPVSIMYELLPILNDENPGDKIEEAVKAVRGLSVKDAKQRIKEIRGVAADPNDPQPAMFKIIATDKDSFMSVRMMCSTNNNYYEVTQHGAPLIIQKADWPRFEALFKGAVEIT